MILNTLHNCFIYAKKINKDCKIPTAVCKENFRYFVVTSEVCVDFRKTQNQTIKIFKT
jgi:hypothetical protein